MTKTAVLFPGQGSQKVGMATELIEKYPQTKSLFQQADDVLGKPLSSLIQEGPMEALTDTRNAQPAIYVVSMAMYSVLKDRIGAPVAVAGHSLGEISAYVAAGVLTFEQGLTIINKRANAMADSYPSSDSAMSAVIGTEPDVIQSVCDGVSDTVVVANYNCPGQIVISGTTAGVSAASDALKAQGAKVIPLPVSGAFHSPLMANASEELAAFLTNMSFKNATIPVILNRSAKPETDGTALKANLPIQITSSVLWTQSVQTLSGMASQLMECGPGKVLSGLVKKIDREIDIKSAAEILEI